MTESLLVLILFSCSRTANEGLGKLFSHVKKKKINKQNKTKKKTTTTKKSSDSQA